MSDDEEDIRDSNQLRNTKKKLGKKEQKLKKSPTPELQAEIEKLRILIREYEHKDKSQTSHKKTKKEPKKEEDFDFDEIKKFNEQRERETREVNERKRKEKRKRDEDSAKYWKNYKEKYQGWRDESHDRHWEKEREGGERNQSDPESENIQGLLKFLKFKKEELPDDICEIIDDSDDFDKSKWKKLCMKYHPDKYKGDENYIILLNNIKDYYEPNVMEKDETWTKIP